MELNYLAEFVALAENCNYMETAETLFISQSTLSKHIMKLEKELGISLFDRTTRNVKLSEDGKLLLPHAIRMVQIYQGYLNTLKACSANKKEITFASTYQITHYNIIMEAINKFKHDNPSIKIDIVIDSHNAVKRLVAQSRADFAWVGESMQEMEAEDAFLRIPYMEEPMVAIFPNKTGIIVPEKISLRDLQNYHVAMQDHSSMEQQVILDCCSRMGIVVDVSSMPLGTMMTDFVERGVGIAVVLRTAAQNLTSPHVTIVDIEDSPVAHVNMIHLKDGLRSLAADSFLTFIQECLKNQSREDGKLK